MGPSRKRLIDSSATSRRRRPEVVNGNDAINQGFRRLLGYAAPEQASHDQEPQRVVQGSADGGAGADRPATRIPMSDQQLGEHLRRRLLDFKDRGY